MIKIGVRFISLVFIMFTELLDMCIWTRVTIYELIVVGEIDESFLV